MARTKEYKAVRNFFVNEIGLSKQEIKQLATEAIQDEARKHTRLSLSNSGEMSRLVQKVLIEELKNQYSPFRTMVASVVSGILKDKIHVTVNQDGKE